MNRNVKQRVIVALVAALTVAVLGALGGYWAGRSIALRMAVKKLGQDATQAISDSVAYSRDAHAVLDAMSALPGPRCSDEDMAALLRLVYQSHFLKAAGRMHDGRILCSTSAGRLEQPGVEQPKYDSIGADGVRVYRNPPLFRLDDVSVTGLLKGDAYVVLNPYISSLRDAAPPQVRTTVIDPVQSQAAHLADPQTHLTWAMLTTDSDFRTGDTYYSTRCSYAYNTCTTASLPVFEALNSNRKWCFYGGLLGALAGAWVGLLVSLVYQRSLSMEQQLRRAVRKDQLNVVYQPIVSIPSAEIVGAEALARWKDEDGFPVGPDIFIRVAEERGFVSEITRLVVRRVLHDFAGTLRANPDFHLSVNVAATDLKDPNFLPMLKESVDRAAVPPESLVIEITESSTVQHKTAEETIRQLHERGHSVHIDDFGTGYSSLSYLNDLSVDAIKIDRSFTQTIGTDAVIVGILPQILAMAHTLGLKVIVEGVETPEQLTYFAAEKEPVLGQGWLFGHPVTAEEFHCLLNEDENAAAGQDSTAADSGEVFIEA
ncbi:MAG: EAL domain-containing protein [Terracidiphilus sp.]|jgi:sensor c-di-GMP phosphodiesterase-like protein